MWSNLWNWKFASVPLCQSFRPLLPQGRGVERHSMEKKGTGFSSSFCHFCYLEMILAFQTFLISSWTDNFGSHPNASISQTTEFYILSTPLLESRLFKKPRSTLGESEFFPSLAKSVLNCCAAVRNVIFFPYLPIRALNQINLFKTSHVSAFNQPCTKVVSQKIFLRESLYSETTKWHLSKSHSRHQLK